MIREQMHEPPFGEKLSPVLEEIERAIWEYEAQFPNDLPGYTKGALRAAVKIFMAVFWEMMYLKMRLDGVPYETAMEMAEKAGSEMRDFVFAYTGMDMHQLTEEWLERGGNEAGGTQDKD